jgi:hypothetical protein
MTSLTQIAKDDSRDLTRTVRSELCELESPLLPLAYKCRLVKCPSAPCAKIYLTSQMVRHDVRRSL